MVRENVLNASMSLLHTDSHSIMRDQWREIILWFLIEQSSQNIAMAGKGAGEPR